MSTLHYIAELQKKARIRLMIAGGLVIGVGVAVVVPGVLGTMDKYNAKATLAATIDATEKKLSSDRSTYSDLKDKYAQTASTDSDKILTILPTDSDETTITRTLEDMVNSLQSSSAPLFLSNITFSKAITKENTPYATIPFKLSVTANKPNPAKPSDPQGDSVTPLLQFFEQSGQLQSATPARFMDIQSFTINTKDSQQLDPSGKQLGNTMLELTVNAYALPNAKTVTAPAKAPADAAATPAK